MPHSGLAHHIRFSSKPRARGAARAPAGRTLLLILPLALSLAGCASSPDVRLGPLFSFMQKPKATTSQPTALAAATAESAGTEGEGAAGMAAAESGGPRPSPLVAFAGEDIPRGGGRYQVGNAYSIGGKVYQPEENPFYAETGLASWYGGNFQGRMTANGEVFDAAALTAAHPTLPLPSYVRVTNLANDRSVVVRVNDRGPYSGSRLIDVSERAADMLGFRWRGTTKVRVEYVRRAPIDGDDTPFLLASYRTDSSVAPMGPEFAVAATAPALVPALVATRPAAPAEPAIDAYTSAFAPAGTLQDSFSAGEVEAAYLFRSSYLDEEPRAEASADAFEVLKAFAAQ